jgi:hypothetical protein
MALRASGMFTYSSLPSTHLTDGLTATLHTANDASVPSWLLKRELLFWAATLAYGVDSSVPLTVL